MTNRAQRRVSILESICWWLGGSGADTMARTPDFERRKHSAAGATVLVPTLFGGLACAYMASTISENTYVIIAAGILWGFFILTIDRALLSAYRPSIPRSRKMVQFALRFSVAVLIGLVVSHPVVLLIFKDSISVELKEQQTKLNEVHHDRLHEKGLVLDSAVLAQQETLGAIQAQLSNSFTPLELPSLPSSPNQGDLSAQLNEIEALLVSQKAEKQTIESEIKALEKKLEMELAGEGISRKPGVGPHSRRIESDIARSGQRLRQADEALAILLEQQTTLVSASAAQAASPDVQALITAQLKSQRARLEQYSSTQQSLRESLEVQLGATSGRITALRAQQDEISRQQTEVYQSVPPRDLVANTLALHAIFEKKGGELALAVYLILSFTIIVLDTLPLISKYFAKPGPYDAMIAEQERKWEPVKPLPIPGSVAKQLGLPAPPKEAPEPFPAINPTDHPLVSAEKIATVKDRFASKAELAERLEISRDTLSRYLKIGSMDSEAKAILAEMKVTLDVAYSLAGLKPTTQLRLLKIGAEKRFTSSDFRKAIADLSRLAKAPVGEGSEAVGLSS